MTLLETLLAEDQTERRHAAEVTTRARTITDTATTEGRALTENELVELRSLQEAADRRAADAEARRERIENLQNRATSDATAQHRATELGLRDPAATTTKNGVTTLTRGESVADWTRAQRGAASNTTDGFDLGRALRGVISGEWDGADIERRAMGEGTLAGGGYTIPLSVAADIIDRTRNAARVIQAGALTQPMMNANLRLPRLDTDPTAAWRNELAPITDSTPALSAVDLNARTLAAMVRISNELWQDSVGVGEAIANAIGSAMANELDRAALLGTGTAPEPRGLRNTAGVLVVPHGGANGASLTTYAPFITAMGAVRNVNHEPTAILWSARTQTTTDGLLDTTNQPQRIPDAIANVPRYWTNQIGNTDTVGTSTDCSTAYVGNWQHLVIGMRAELTIRLLTERFADTGEVALLAWMRADIAVTRPNAFSIVTGIRP